MCKYCGKKEKNRKCIINNPVVSLRIIEANELNWFEIISFNRKKEIITSYQFIKFCPMCGRKLGDD